MVEIGLHEYASQQIETFVYKCAHTLQLKSNKLDKNTKGFCPFFSQFQNAKLEHEMRNPNGNRYLLARRIHGVRSKLGFRAGRFPCAMWETTPNDLGSDK